MDLRGWLAAFCPRLSHLRSPRRAPWIERLWRILALVAQWIQARVAMMRRAARPLAREVHTFVAELEQAGREGSRAMRPRVLRLASNRRAQGVAGLIGVCALLLPAGLARAQFMQPRVGI